MANMHRNKMQDEESILACAELFRKDMLPLSEAVERTRRAVDYLEGQINRIDKKPWKHDKERRTNLSTLFMELLAEEYGGIVPPSEDK